MLPTLEDLADPSLLPALLRLIILESRFPPLRSNLLVLVPLLRLEHLDMPPKLLLRLARRVQQPDYRAKGRRRIEQVLLVSCLDLVPIGQQEILRTEGTVERATTLVVNHLRPDLSLVGSFAISSDRDLLPN